MAYLLNWRLIAGVVFLCLLPLMYFQGRSDGKKLILAEVNAAKAQAAADVRKIETLRQSRVDEAARDAAARERRILADAARARDAASGLRDDLDAVRLHASQSLAASNNALRTVGELLEHCSAEYLRVSEAADRATSEALTLRQAWPR